VAPPSSGQMRPSRYLFALAAIFIILYALVLGTGSGSLRDRFAPRLAIDLAGGTQMVLQARTPDGSAPDASRLEQARRIIEERVNARGVTEAEVYVLGNDKIVVAVPGQSDDGLREVGQTAEMRFRKVLAWIIDNPNARPPAATEEAESGEESDEGTESGEGTESAESTESGEDEASPEPSPSESATDESGEGGQPTATPAPSPTNEALPTLDEVKAKLGDAYTAADEIDLAQVAQGGASSTLVTGNAELMEKLEAFRDLTPAEIAVLPYNIQYVVPQIGCQKLNARPVGSIVDPNQRAVACEESGGYKYLLDVAKVEGRDLADAQAVINPQTGLADWQVNLRFSTSGRDGRPSGSDLWGELTREAWENAGDVWGSGAGTSGVPENPNCIATQISEDGSRNVCMVAAVLDNEIVTAPAIQGVLFTESTITGDFTKASAQTLATQLKYGALPVSFETASLDTVTATLGSDYLRAGLLAAAIGMGLVVLYAFFYYRLLGSVIMLSLVLSALLTFGMLVLLGRGIGFALSLAGIAGFIVSLGVAADSFVIYFERLKDEIREGRSPRAAVNRAWTRARRTIITANAVTIMAAVVLYILGTSAVRGFAFALGLATLLDLIIVFLFRHPMMTMLARTPAFLSPRVSGLGRIVAHGKADGGRTRTKEA
jgi:protein-export membrane protein, SecD/SecF family